MLPEEQGRKLGCSGTWVRERGEHSCEEHGLFIYVQILVLTRFPEVEPWSLYLCFLIYKMRILSTISSL